MKELLLAVGIAALLNGHPTYPVEAILPEPIGVTLRLSDLTIPTAQTTKESPKYDGPRLNPTIGTIQGPTNKETYYNLDMTRVVKTMRRRGYSESDYPYYIREDGAKMLGDYVIVSADLSLHPRGVLVRTSLGTGIVCDTGDFTEKGDWYDIATDW